MPVTTREKAISSLLKRPAARYVRKLKRSLDRDPKYLESHLEDVGNIIIGFLAGSGFQWHRKIFEREWLGILQDALNRLPSSKG